MSISGKRTYTATYEGATGTRRSARPYTHAVFAITDNSGMIRYYESQAATSTDPEWVARCNGWVEELKAQPQQWSVVSWHQGEKNAQAGLVAAQRLQARGAYLKVALVEAK